MSSTTPYSDKIGEFRLGFRTRSRDQKCDLTTEFLGAATFWGVAAALVAAIAAPLFLLGVPPLDDYPAHLVRVTLLSHLPLDPLTSQWWQADLRLLPNLAMDAFVMTVAPFVGAALGLKLFLSLGIALWVAGAALLYRAIWREWSPQPLFAVFFAVNPSLSAGFVNSYFGMGLALTAAGGWALTRKRPAWLLASMSVVAVVLLICHLMAVAVLALLLGGLEIGRLWEERASPARIARSLAEGIVVFLPAALAWAFVFEHGGSGGIEFKWLNNLAALFVYSSSAGAVDHNFLPVIAMLGAQCLAWRQGRLDISRVAAPAATLAAVAMLLCPAVALSGAFIHIRLPALVCVLLLVAARIVVSPEWRKPALVALLVAASASGALEYARWRPGAQTIAAIRSAAKAHIKRGARVASAIVDPRADYALSHAVSMVALDRSAFIPDFFTYRGQSTIIVKDAYRRLAAANAAESAIPSLKTAARLLGARPPILSAKDLRSLRPYRNMACDFDYLYVIGRLAPDTALPPALKTLVVGDGFTLFRINAPPERDCAPR
jgi:hypothetical protein